MQDHRMGLRDAMLAAVALAVAGALRAAYVSACLDAPLQEPPFQVQDAETAIALRGPGTETPSSNSREVLVENLKKNNWFGGTAPLSDMEEPTAQISPGYPWAVAIVSGWAGDPTTATQSIVWAQAALGALTAMLYYLLGRMLFDSSAVGFLTGLLTAVNPFWIVSVAEMQDGALASFLLAAAMVFGTAAAKRGNPLASLVFGGLLAALALVRAAWLPYSFVACLWFLLSCRTMPRGWVCALLMVLGLSNGLGPWTVRNFQTFGEVIPIVDSTYVDLWIGNNKAANGGPMDEAALRASLDPERLASMLAEDDQAKRYRMLANDTWATIEEDPGAALGRRLRAALCFGLGSAWMDQMVLWRGASRSSFPAWITLALPEAFPLVLLVMFFLGLFGWRWSYGWRQESNLASLALVWIPLPYILSHGDKFSGARLPLDGVLLCFAAFALTWIMPPVARAVFAEPEDDG